MSSSESNKKKLMNSRFLAHSNGQVIFRMFKKPNKYLGPTIDGVPMMLIEVASGPVIYQKPEFL